MTDVDGNINIVIPGRASSARTRNPVPGGWIPGSQTQTRICDKRLRLKQRVELATPHESGTHRNAIKRSGNEHAARARQILGRLLWRHSREAELCRAREYRDHAVFRTACGVIQYVR